MKRDLVDVWELKVSLSPAIADESIAAVRDKVREVADREAAASVGVTPFLWMTRGALLIVRSQGGPFSLMEIADWVLMNSYPDPKGFELYAKRMAPLAKLGGWQGYGTD